MQEANGSKISKVYFFDIGYGVRGGAYLVIEFAKYLLDNTDIKVAFIDYPDGFIPEIFDDERVEFIPYSEHLQEFDLDDNSVLFIAPDRLTFLRKLKKKDNNVRVLHIFWETTIAWRLIFSNRQIKDLGELFKEKNGIVFVDKGCRRVASHQFKTQFEKHYLPVYHPLKDDGAAPPPLVDKDVINFGWLGRVSDQKSHSIINILDVLYESSDSRKKRFHIIGNGLHEKELKRQVSRYSDKIEVIFCGRMTGAALDNYMREHIDVLYAMGTSILNGAAVKIPVLAAHNSDAPFVVNQFSWFFDVDGCQLGLSHEPEHIDSKWQTLDEVIKEIYDDGKKEEYGLESFGCAYKEHGDINTIGHQLLDALHRTSVTYSDLSHIIKYMPLNHTLRRAYTFWGIPFLKTVKDWKRKRYFLFGVPFALLKASSNGTILRFYFLGIRLWKSQSWYPLAFSAVTDPKLKGEHKVDKESDGEEA